MILIIRLQNLAMDKLLLLLQVEILLYEQLYYGFLPADVDIKTPPAIYQFYHTPDEPDENQPVTFRAYVDDDTKVQSVKLVTTKNKELPITRLMYDDGLKK